MKKILYIIFLMILFIPSVNASGYKIENYEIDITVLEDGSLNVQEAFKMNSPYNGYERIIYYKNNYNDYLESILYSVSDNEIYDFDDVILNEVRAINYESNLDFITLQENGDLFKKINRAYKGDYGVYVVEKKENGKRYRIYNSSSMNKDLYINYTLENVAISHSDISEIPINIFEFKESIKNLDIYIHLPNNEEILDAWVHKINSKIEFIDSNTIKINIKNIKENSSFDFRIICDKNENFKKKTNEVVYEKILKIEEQLKELSKDIKDEEYENLKNLAYSSVVQVEKSLKREDYYYSFETVSSLNDNDNLKTELLLRLMNVESRVDRKEMLIKLFFTSLLFIWCIILIVLCYQIYKKYDKEYKVTFKDKKIDYIPSKIPVFSIGYLFNKKISNDDLKASILKLIYNENIKFSKINKKDFLLRKNSLDNLNESDLKLIKLLFNDKNSVKFSRIKERISNNYTEFLNNYSNWITRATIESEELEFFEDILSYKIFGIIISIIGFIMSILLINCDTYFSSYFTLIISCFTFFYFIFFNKRTIKGYEQKAKYNALKNYFNNFSRTSKEVDLDKIFEYLIYSLSLGNYNKLKKEIIILYKEHKKNRQVDKILELCDFICLSLDKLLDKAYNKKNYYYYD